MISHVRADEARGVQFEWLNVTGMYPKYDPSCSFCEDLVFLLVLALGQVDNGNVVEGVGHARMLSGLDGREHLKRFTVLKRIFEVALLHIHYA
jgi:hypothetical protein